MNAVSRPVLRWHGGKWLLAPWVIEHFPRHKIYCEPFGGAASVLLRKPRIVAEVYNDLDDKVVSLFQLLQDVGAAAELHRRLELTPFARSVFLDSYSPAADEIDAAHKLIVRAFMGHGSDSVTRTCRTGFRGKLSNGRAFPSQAWSNYVQCIPEFVARLQGVLIERDDAKAVMRRADSRQTLHYVDPPYLHSTRSSVMTRSKKTHGYTHELTTEQHKELLTFVKTLTGMVVISGYPSTLYDRALKRWRRLETPALADGALPRTEVLWLNPACAAALDAERLPLLERLNR